MHRTWCRLFVIWCLCLTVDSVSVARTIRVTFGHKNNLQRLWEGEVRAPEGGIRDVSGWLTDPGAVNRDGGFKLQSPAPDPAATWGGRRRGNARIATFFWAKDTSGRYHGYGVPRRIDFLVPAGDRYHVIRLHPQWADDAQVIKVRFDPPAYASFDIDSFRILKPAKGGGAPQVVKAWEFDKPDDREGWTHAPSVTDVAINDGAFHGRCAAPNPSLENVGTFPVTADTYVEIKIRWLAAGDFPVTGPLVHQGVLIRTRDGADRLDVNTNAGNFSVDAAQLVAGQPVERLDGDVLVELVPDAVRLTDRSAEDDFPAIAVDAKGIAYCAWVSYRDRADRVMISDNAAGDWSAPTEVTESPGDIFRVKLAFDGSGRLWAVWAQQVAERWNLFARSFRDGRWSPTQQLTDSVGPDFFHELAAGPNGDLWLVYQSGRDGNFEIYLKHFDGRSWSPDIRVTNDLASDWEPSLAVDSRGTVHIVWDTYRNGNYDVYATMWSNGKLGPTVPVAATDKFEAHATVACDREDHVWVAWDEGDAQWGKDWGMQMDHPPGAPLHQDRSLRLARLDPDGVRLPASDPYTAISESDRVFCEHPLLTVDASGRLWLMYRYLVARAQAEEKALVLMGAAWGVGALCYDGDKWTRVPYFAHSEGRDDESVMALTPDAKGKVWFAWSADERPRGTSNIGTNEIFAGAIDVPPGPAQPPMTGAPLVSTADVVPWQVPGTTITLNGQQLLLLCGDLHRHTEISADGHKDGTLFEAYRYAIDAADMDFLAVTDHNAGGDREYPWWRTQQSCDLFRIPGRFTPLYAYERSEPYPYGHRNIVFAERGIRTLPTFLGPDKHIAADDTKRLYASLRETHGIAIPHTIATDQGTDWRDHDPKLEPVMELFQGLRNQSYEYAGAPRAVTPDSQPAKMWGYEEAGFAWKAWAKGLRLGVIAASDHISTHISYACVYARSRSREDILDAIRARHTFAATDRIVMDVRARTATDATEWFMGDDVHARGQPRLQIHIVGTGEIKQVDVVRDNAIVFTRTPGCTAVDLEYEDQQAAPGAHFYYVRMIQTNGQMAWSSPIWITLDRV